MDNQVNAGSQKISRWFDEGTFVQFGAGIRKIGEPEGLLCGYGAVEGKLVYATDFTDKDGKIHKAGEELDQDTIIMAPVTFTAEKKDEIHEVRFTGIDATKLEGASIVVFESLYHPENNEGENKLVDTHEDIKDEDQTIHYAKIGTTLTDQQTHTHQAVAKEELTLVDTVRYENLVPGKKYTFSGILYDKATGKPLLDADGKEVTSELVDYVPKKADGTVDVTFTFKNANMKTHSIVAAETVKHEGQEVAVHKDLSDEDQTVTVVPPQDYPKTGDVTDFWIWAGIFCGAVVAASVGLTLMKKKIKKNKSKAE